MDQEFELFLKEEGKSPNTLKRYLSVASDFMTWHKQTTGADEFHPNKVTALDLQDYKQYLLTIAKTKQEKKYSVSSVNNMIEAIRTFFRFLDEKNHIPFNPATKLKKVSQQNENLTPRWLDRNEKNRLLLYIDDPRNREKNEKRYARNRAIVYLMLHGGLRASEVAGLELEDIQFNKGRLAVLGKRQKLRYVQINTDLKRALEEWLEQRGIEADTNKVFTSQMGILTLPGVEHLFRRIKKDTGLGELTPHVLRHTFCHDLIGRGVPLPWVADIAGHDDINTTRRYLGSDEKERKRAVDLLSSERF